MTILLDISGSTLRRRAMMRPLLDLIKSLGGSYRWGAPFHMVARKEDGSTFLLRHPTELPELFNFLGTPPIDVPNWLHLARSQQRRTQI